MVIAPRGHVVVVGEPRAGRSTVLAALRRVLDADASRGALVDDLDFFNRDRDKRIEIEAVVGHLTTALTQQFFDHLEYWDAADDKVIEASPDATLIAELEPVVRLCYRASWSANDEQAEHWVDYPKTSDPEAGVFDRVRRADLGELPFVASSQEGRPLALHARGRFRALIDQAPGDDFPASLDTLVAEMQRLGGELVATDQVKVALDAVLEALRCPLGIGAAQSSEVLAFAPGGGGLNGVLRALSATATLSSPPGPLPLAQHGSTLISALTTAELLVAGCWNGGVVSIDDFGENLDDSTTRHLASQLRRSATQVWIATRRAAAAAAFRPVEIMRLSHGDDGGPEVHQGNEPTTKAERIAARHLHLQILPAMAARALAILEGPHDRAGYEAVAERRMEVTGDQLPAAKRITLVDAGASDASGGASATRRLAAAARRLGFFTVVVVDGDAAGQAASVDHEAHAVIVLPAGVAIERALVDGLDDAEIRAGLAALDVSLQADPHALSGDALSSLAIGTLKSAGGFHAQFVDGLPSDVVPQTAARVLGEIERVVRERDTGVHLL